MPFRIKARHLPDLDSMARLGSYCLTRAPTCWEDALTTAATIAGMPRMAAMVNKEMVNAAFETPLEQALIHERRLFQILTATQDKAEGMAAFVEKRAPVWTGH